MPLEKQADMLIADYLRPKDAPLTSYSWKFIIDSVQNGYRQVPDRYSIHGDPEDQLGVVSSGPKKAFRTPFTPQDDAELVAYILQVVVRREGNEVHKEFEKTVSLPCLTIQTLGW